MNKLKVGETIKTDDSLVSISISNDCIFHVITLMVDDNYVFSLTGNRIVDKNSNIPFEYVRYHRVVGNHVFDQFSHHFNEILNKINNQLKVKTHSPNLEISFSYSFGEIANNDILSFSKKDDFYELYFERFSRKYFISKKFKNISEIYSFIQNLINVYEGLKNNYVDIAELDIGIKHKNNLNTIVNKKKDIKESLNPKISFFKKIFNHIAI